MKPVPVPPPEVGPALRAGLVRRLRLAWAALLWERLWPLVLPPLCLIGLFAAFALFDVAPLLPGWLHGLVLAGTAGGLGFLLVRAALRLRLPGWDEAARRLERDSGLDHRPLAVLVDRPAADDPLALALWQAHLHRACTRLDRLRLRLPHPNMAARDPWGLRAGVLLVLVIALAGAWHDAPRRLARALNPAVSASGLGADAVEVWLTPPAYTGLPPVLLVPHTAQPVTVPVGSAVLAVLSGGWGTAKLAINSDAQSFERQSDGSQRAEARLDRPGTLAVRQAGFTLAQWQVGVAADALPSAAFALPPEAGERGRLRLAVTASDDYGLTRLWVEMRRVGVPADDAPVEVELPLAASHPRSAETAGWYDLTAHPWAGTPVTLRPIAADGAGQTGAGEAVVITLPERDFANPVARALAEARRALTEDPELAPEVAALLDRVAAEPPLFNDDLKTFLMLRAARHALEAEEGFDLAEVQDLLWQAALRIEDGELAGAERSLDEARKALEQAVEQGASGEQLQALLDQFQQALERYMQALAERMARDGQPPPLPQADSRVISDEELRGMVDQLRDLVQAGATEALRQMLSQMGQMLDGLQAGSGQQAGGPAQDGLRQLRDLARRQQQMLDGSHRRAQGQEGGGGGGGGSSGGAEAAQAQQDLRAALSEAARKLAEGLGEAPAPMADADTAMADAARQLRGGQWGDAADAQAQALAALQQAARETLEQLGGTGQGMQGMVPRDPLGRPLRGAGTGDDGTTRVPDRAEIQRSRQLLEEIRRRAGEAQRPEPERDYLKRLLRQF